MAEVRDNGLAGVPCVEHGRDCDGSSSDCEPEQTTETAQRRLDQIVQTAQRVRPVDVGIWKSARGLPVSPVDFVVIVPADLMWMVERLRSSSEQQKET